MQLGSSSGGWNPVVLDVEPPVAGLAPALRVTQQHWGSTSILLQDGSKLWNCLLLSTFYLLFVESDMSDTGIPDPHHLLREGSLTPCAPWSDPDIDAAILQCTCT